MEYNNLSCEGMPGLEAKLRMALRFPRDEQLSKLLQELPKLESRLKLGQKVKIYRDDPASKTEVEGTAILTAFSGIVNDSLEWWLVQFENGEPTFRWVNSGNENRQQ
jgi:hypothetical protein